MSFKEHFDKASETAVEERGGGPSVRFNPDRRIDVTAERRDSPEKTFDPDKRLDQYFVPYEERLAHWHEDYKDARFVGERGESLAVANPETERGKAASDKLKELGQAGIEYRNMQPDFSKVAFARVEIDMTSHRQSEKGIQGNFEKAYTALANQWNSEARGDRTDWRASDVKAWRNENNLTVHEDADKKTCYFVPREIHDVFLHSGGVAECKRREGLSTGGTFDD